MNDLTEDEKQFLEEIENEMKNRYDGEKDAEFKEYLNRAKSLPPIIEFKKEYNNNNNNNNGYKRKNNNNYNQDFNRGQKYHKNNNY